MAGLIPRLRLCVSGPHDRQGACAARQRHPVLPRVTSAIDRSDGQAAPVHHAEPRIAPSKLVSINSKSKTATDSATVGGQLTNNKAHNVMRYDGMISVRSSCLQ